MGERASDPLEGHPKYRVVRMLGRGGMGEVFEAEHLHLGTRVVVKLLHAELTALAHQVDRMRIEAQALARLQHPNVVRVTDFDTTPSGRPFFVMDYLEGHSLRQELDARGGWLPVGDALEIAKQALAGLASAHRLGLVHRDVKLDNLFLCEPPRGAEPASPRLGGRTVKVLDFGVAKVLAGDGGGPAPLAVPTATGIIVGTPRFLSPEQALGKAIDHRADLYSFGLVLYTMLVGRGPFDECTTVTDMARAHAFTTPAPPSKRAAQPLPPELDAVVLRCLAKKPEERYQRAEELAKELARIADATSGAGALDTSATQVQVVQAAARPQPPIGAQATALVDTTTDRAPTERMTKPAAPVAYSAQTVALPEGSNPAEPQHWPGWASRAPGQSGPPPSPALPPPTAQGGWAPPPVAAPAAPGPAPISRGAGAGPTPPATAHFGPSVPPASNPSPPRAKARPGWLLPVVIVVAAAIAGSAIAALAVQLF